MAHQGTQEEIVRVLRKIKKLGGLSALATVSDLSRRTVYRHTESDDDRVMDGATEAKLVVTLTDLGLLGTDPDHVTYARAVVELKRRASSQVDQDDLAAGEADGGTGVGWEQKAD